MKSPTSQKLSWTDTMTKNYEIPFWIWPPSCEAHVSFEDAPANAIASILEQPFKVPFVAAIVLVINPQKPEIAQEMLSRAAKAMQENLQKGAWREVKLVLRFLACLQGLLEGDGVFPILEELFSRAVDLQTASSEDVRLRAAYNQGSADFTARDSA